MFLVLAHDPETGEPIGHDVANVTARVIRHRGYAETLGGDDLLTVVYDLLDMIPRHDA